MGGAGNSEPFKKKGVDFIVICPITYSCPFDGDLTIARGW